jgi:hypothetical protein
VTGPAKEEYEERGLCMRTVEYIFRSIKSIQDFVITVRFSVIEIYNDNVMDLLRESLHDSPKLVIVDTPNGVIVPALYLLPIENEEEAFAKLYEANLNRFLLLSVSASPPTHFPQIRRRAPTQSAIQPVPCHLLLLHYPQSK